MVLLNPFRVIKNQTASNSVPLLQAGKKGSEARRAKNRSFGFAQDRLPSPPRQSITPLLHYSSTPGFLYVGASRSSATKHMRLFSQLLRDIHDLSKVLKIVLQISAELGAYDEIRLELKLFKLAAHAFHRAPFAQRRR
jgi:hypothetical protein